jgi:hypothetical protein
MKLRIRLRKTPGHHWKLMTATLAAFSVAGILAIMGECLATGFAILLGVATLAVQWFCIDPPYVDDADLH